jgi:NAD(P)H dehydrogenase (quinone)
MSVIAVTGASGEFGRHAVEVLAGRGVGARALTRAGADYDEPGTLREGLRGVGRLLFVSSPELDTARRVVQHRNVVGAAREAGVEAIVYTGFHEIAGLFEAHGATEEALRASGIAHTVLRNPFYSDPFRQAAGEAGELVHATGGGALNTASRAELAEAAVAALLGDGHDGRALTLTGPAWTYAELGERLGKNVRDGDVPGSMGWLHSLARAGRLAAQTPHLAHLLGRPPAPIA